MKINRYAPCYSVAFTLVELLVVIVVIALLVSITLPITRYAALRAKEAKQEAMLVQIRAALDEYRATYGEYPITPIMVTNGGVVSVQNVPDVARHYSDNYLTPCAYTTNSPFTNVDLVNSGVVEKIETFEDAYEIDYSLTYPLMLKQLDKKKRPFMEFDEVTVLTMVYRTRDGTETKRFRRKRDGGVVSKDVGFIYGNPVNRVKAIDPVTGYQWNYVCHDGVNYEISTINEIR